MLASPEDHFHRLKKRGGGEDSKTEKRSDF